MYIIYSTVGVPLSWHPLILAKAPYLGTFFESSRSNSQKRIFLYLGKNPLSRHIFSMNLFFCLSSRMTFYYLFEILFYKHG